MTDPRQQWDIYMVQAQRFARRENFIDALGRVRLVLAEIDESLAAKPDSSLELLRSRVARREAIIRAEFEVWNAKIAARRQAAIHAAAEEMARPLPWPAGKVY